MTSELFSPAGGPWSLHGKRALVTGASRGIGRSLALGLAAAGARVAVTARQLDSLDPLLEELRELGGSPLPLACDVADSAQVRALARDLGESLGGIDILVNNAGQAQSEKFLGHSDELWNRLIAVNLTGVFQVTREVVPLMLERKWGRVINIASTASKVGGKYIAAYTASKHGVLGLTRALALELVVHGITVNAVCPGYVDTAMTDSAIDNIVMRTRKPAQEARRLLAQISPQQRLIEPREVADLVVWLAGEQSQGITGQAINIDGGTVMF